MQKYDHQAIEEKWKKVWEDQKIYQPDLKSAKKPFYNLMMFPYPSAEGLHVGNVYAFTGADIYGRFYRMRGFDTFEPIGLDGFGIHSENYALKISKNPMDQSKVSETNFYRQLHSIGNGFDWAQKVETYDPNYYKWTQWLFIQLFKAGLAEKRKAPVNWCPSCKTVLADEQVISGECERCGNKVEIRQLEQWFFKITDYAERLLNDLSKIDWSEKVVNAQRNWIGRSEGLVLTFETDMGSPIKVFTTRPDTFHGVTFIAISVHHPILNSVKNLSNDVLEFINKLKTNEKKAKNREQKEVSGVFSGYYVTHPATGTKLPIWITDYVLKEYGEGAVMGVPAHDERDYIFAKKYDLPIKPVIEALFSQYDGVGGIKKDQPFVEREAIKAIVKHWSEDKYLVLKWKKVAWGTWITGGVEKGQTPEEAAISEIKEETGYLHPVLKKTLLRSHSRFYHVPKAENRFAHFHNFYFELADGEKKEISNKEKEIHEVKWLSEAEIESFLTPEDHIYAWKTLLGEIKSYEGAGIIANSKELNGLLVPDEMQKVIDWLVKKGIGEKKVHYHLRDWLISRQRYWGAPIPMIYCQKDGWQAVPEKELPVVLPHIKNFKPLGTGVAPLAQDENFVKTKCPKCGEEARRETDVCDTFLDSSWYFLRYPSAHLDNIAFDPLLIQKWLPVNMYTGGAEHSVLHLLYSRFITKVLFDLKLVSFDEPFPKFRAHGLLIKDGAKMSKSKGNIVNPDDYIVKFGADTLRCYLMFSGPFEQGGDFRDSGIEGMNRFLKRVWVLANKQLDVSSAKGSEAEKNLDHEMNKTIKGVIKDIENLHYNTALSKIMIYTNELTKHGQFENKYLETLLLLLAPFAPFMTEELWQKMGKKPSIHLASWPSFDEAKTRSEEVTIAVQINGKVRSLINISQSEASSQDLIEAKAKEDPKIIKHLEEKSVKKVIYVPGKVINFVHG